LAGFRSCPRSPLDAQWRTSRRSDLKHFINKELLAPNALTVPVDFEIVREFTDLAVTNDLGADYFSLVPWSEFSDIRWISAATPVAFDRFQDAFHRMGVADHVREYLDLEDDVRFYTGFLHTRRECKEINLHVDWVRTNNEGFTLITPICGPQDEQRLMYQTMTGEIAEYRYKLGEAIIFGDYFTHSSPVGVSETPVSLLVFNFGTDKMDHWEKLVWTQQRQCPLVQRPDGKFIRIDPSMGLSDPSMAIARSDLDFGAREVETKIHG
jgi:hypothetical protein